MPTLKGPVAGARQPYRLRTGIDIVEFAGINKQKDAGAIAENQFQLLRNARLRGGRIYARGGQEKYNSSTMTGCNLGIFPFSPTATNFLIAPTAGGAPIYFNSQYLGGANPAPGPTDYTFTTTFPGLHALGLAPTGTTVVRKVFARYGSTLLAFSSDGWVWKITPKLESFPHLLDDGVSPIFGVVSMPAERLFHPSAVYATALPNTYATWRGKLWMASRDGHVYTWDGSIFSRDTTVARAVDGVIFQYQEDIYVAVSGALYQRAGGAWSSVTLPALTDFRPHAAGVWNNKAYIGGMDKLTADHGDGVVLQLSGTVTEVAREVDHAIAGHTVSDWEGVSDILISSTGGGITFAYTRRSNGSDITQTQLATGFAAGAFTSNVDFSGISLTDKNVQIGWIRASGSSIFGCTSGLDMPTIDGTAWSIFKWSAVQKGIITLGTPIDLEPPSWDAVLV